MTTRAGYWTVFRCEQQCTCRTPHAIPAGAPVRVVAQAVYRCAAHAHVPVNPVEVDQAQQELRQPRAHTLRDAPDGQPRFDRARFSVDLARALRAPRLPQRCVRVRPARPPRPYSQLRDLPFDPKAAAVGDGESKAHRS